MKSRSAAKAKGKTAPSAKAKKKKTASRPGASKADADSSLRLIERRKHPRFLLSREQFRETKTGRIFPVYDLSASGLSIRIDTRYWEPGTVLSGILNLHPDSIEISPRVMGYYGDSRAALKLESLSTYSKSVLDKALSPRRLGASLALVREKLPIVDYWFHGVCNTDLLLKLNPQGDIAKVELFFSNFYWNWSEFANRCATGVCQSFGENREGLLLAEEPVKLESVDIMMDGKNDPQKILWARGIVEAAPLEPRLKETLLKKFEAQA